MDYYKFKEKSVLMQMDSKDALHEYLEMYKAFLSNMNETIQFCEDVNLLMEHGTDVITLKHAILCFKQAQVLLGFYAENLDSCKSVLEPLACNYEIILDDVKDFRKQIRKLKLKSLYLIIMSQVKSIGK